MEFNWRVLLFLIILLGIFWINYKNRNIVVRFYNYVTQLPKVFMIGIGMIIVFAPFLLKNNSLIYYTKDFLPDSLNKKIDELNDYTIKQKNYELSNQGQVSKRRGGEVPTRLIRKVTEQMKKYTASNQKWKCLKCGVLLDATYEVDHRISLEDGGSNDISNLQALCRNCHGKKTMMDNIKRKYPDGKIY